MRLNANGAQPKYGDYWRVLAHWRGSDGDGLKLRGNRVGHALNAGGACAGAPVSPLVPDAAPEGLWATRTGRGPARYRDRPDRGDLRALATLPNTGTCRRSPSTRPASPSRRSRRPRRHAARHRGQDLAISRSRRAVLSVWPEANPHPEGARPTTSGGPRRTHSKAVHMKLRASRLDRVSRIPDTVGDRLSA
jgi:hypothetical protein